MNIHFYHLNRFQKQNVKFIHTYNFTNHGPSPTKDDKIIEIYVPISQFLNKTTNPIVVLNTVNTSDCVFIETRMFKNVPKIGQKDEITCSSTNYCMKFNCIVPSNWEKGKSKIIQIDLQFLTENAKSEKEKKMFTIFTHAKIVQSKICVF